MERLKLKEILFMLILLLTLQSCAGMKDQGSSTLPPQTPPQTPPQALPQKPANIKQTPPTPGPAQQAQVAHAAQKHIDAGEYQSGIDIYSSECRRQPRESHLPQMYAKSLEGIKSTADNAFEKKDFAQAGRLYHILNKNYAKFSNCAKMLSFNAPYLNTRLSHCKKSLSVQGFQEYRNGRINNALLLWQGVLDIDPNNKDIKEAVRTAKLQQKNLSE